MLKRKISQQKKVLAWLKEGFPLSPLEALREFGCFRLAAIIYDLRRKGYKIKTDRTNRYGIYYLQREE